jgi:CubicO group peptidase (beta-lactamase class C family)
MQIKTIDDISLSQQIDSYLSILSEQEQLSGAMLIAQNDLIIFEGFYNKADREKNILNQNDIYYKIASITKPITATAIFQLHEKKQLSLNDPIGKFIPDFKNGSVITIKHLLSHTSGIPDISSLETFQELKNTPTTSKQTASLIKNFDLVFGPGSKHEYSSSNYLLLSYIIELVSGITYEEYIHQNILKPLNMNDSFFYPVDQNKTNIAHGYVKEHDAIKEAPFLHMSWPKGSGGLYSKPRDLLLLSNALNTNKLITEESFNSMTSIIIPMAESGMSYGYGYEIGFYKNKKYIGHPGKMFGFSSYFIKFLEDDITIILLENLEDSLNNTKQKILNLAEILLMA